MQRVFICRREPPRRTIDITPGARGRRLLRGLRNAALLLVALPVLWLLGALAVLVLLGGATAIFAWWAFRAWQASRPTPKRRVVVIDPR